jgi:hypothetical protein
MVIDCLLESSPSSPEDNTDGTELIFKFSFFFISIFFFTGESTVKSQHVSENGDDYVDLTMDALSLTNNNTKPSLNKLNYTQIEPLELDYISMEEIIRVCFFIIFFYIAFIVVFVFVGVCC